MLQFVRVPAKYLLQSDRETTHASVPVLFSGEILKCVWVNVASSFSLMLPSPLSVLFVSGSRPFWIYAVEVASCVWRG